MENSILKYILPLLAILLSLTVMQLFCDGADNSLLYYFEPQIQSVESVEIDYNFSPKIPLSELSGNTKIAIIKNPTKSSSSSSTKSYSVVKPGKRSSLFRR